jgi:SAM-dependent methyltransferase
VTKSGYPVVRCTGCGLIFVWPQPTAEELEAFYAAPAYHAAVDAAERRATFARRLRQIEELVPRRGRVLDVGCSKGLFLEVARAEGWDAAGVDVNRRAVEEARARGLDARHGELQVWHSRPGCAPTAEGRCATFEPASCDVVTLFDLLEHARDPRSLLAACRTVLRPGGLLVVTTPDSSGLVPRLTYWLFGATLGAWGHPTPPGHLVQFSRRTLRRMLEAEGFEPALVRREHIPVAYSVGKLEDSILDVLAGRHRVKSGGVGESAECGAGNAECGAGNAECGMRNAESGGPTAGCSFRTPHSSFPIPESSFPVPHSPVRTPPPSPAGVKSALRRMARLAVRAAAWAVLGPTGVLARATGWGDSMLVAARKPAAPERAT